VFGVDPRQAFKESLDDDFNTAKAIADLSEIFRIANDLLCSGESERAAKLKTPGDISRVLVEAETMLKDAGDVLGLWQEAPQQYNARRRSKGVSKLSMTTEEIEAKIEARNAARRGKDFKLSDQIRDELRAKGIVLKDSPRGTEWYAADD
jgi:cysteinyl-tRNA synthetase